MRWCEASGAAIPQHAAAGERRWHFDGIDIAILWVRWKRGGNPKSFHPLLVSQESSASMSMSAKNPYFFASPTDRDVAAFHTQFNTQALAFLRKNLP
jgi:hypothetical protein